MVKAIHKLTKQKVAIKIMKLDAADPESLQGIEDEVTVHQKLMHEHIAQIYEVIKTPQKICLVMEYCSGGELFSHIVDNGPMAERKAAKIFYQVLSALFYMKRMGIHHRDIKPENILFDENMNAKIVDFGFGCKSQDEMRRTMCGTPSYTPPELLKKMSYSPELMDVWGLGVTLYAMLAAELPFDSDNSDKKKAKIMSCRWKQQEMFSNRANKLFNAIFVEERRRPRLEELLECEFLKNMQF